MFEHRNYLGSVGIVIAVLSLMPMVIRNRAVLVLAAVIGLSSFSYLTWQLSPTWRTPITFFRFAYDIHPESKRLNLTFANAHAKAGEFESARQSLAKVAPGLGKEITSILIDCLQYRKINDLAIRRITQGNKGILNNYTTSTTRSLVREVVVGRCNVSHDALVALLDHVLAGRAQIINDKYNVMFAKANYLESVNQVDAAVTTLVEAQQWSAEHALPLTMAARMLLDNDRPDEARAMLARAYKLNKNTKMRREDIVTSIYLDLARNYAGQDKFQEALAVYATAISAMPGQIVFYLESADLLIKMRHYQDLEQLLAEIRALNLKGVDQYDHLLKRFERVVEQQ